MQIDHQRIASLYREVIASIVNQPKSFKNSDQLVALYPMSGRAEHVDTLYFGRALNGWQWHFTLEELQQDPEEPLEWIVQNSRGEYKPYDERLDWVENQWKKKDSYNTARSQFWQVIRSVSLARQEDAEHWWDAIAWSNLLKVAPYGKNPTQRQIRVIGEASLNLAQEEIAVFKPKNVVCLSGMVWAGDLQRCGKAEKAVPFDESILEYAADLTFGDHTCRFVVAPHPQGKSSSAIAAELIKVL